MVALDQPQPLVLRTLHIALAAARRRSASTLWSSRCGRVESHSERDERTSACRAVEPRHLPVPARQRQFEQRLAERLRRPCRSGFPGEAMSATSVLQIDVEAAVEGALHRLAVERGQHDAGDDQDHDGPGRRREEQAQRKRISAHRAVAASRRGEEIAEPAHGLDHVDAELLADAADEHLDGVGVAVEVLIVEMLDQFGARDHAAGMMHQVGEQPVFVAGELDRIAVDRDAAGAGVEPHRPADELALGVAGGAAQQRADARQHLFEMERLGDIVVGAGVEALHLVAPAVARGENQHRHGAAGAAPGLQHRDAIHFGQADIEDHRVIGLGLAEIVALLAVEGAVDHIAGVGQRRGELPVEVGIVLDHEETQGNFLPVSARRRACRFRRRRSDGSLCHPLRALSASSAAPWAAGRASLSRLRGRRGRAP